MEQTILPNFEKATWYKVVKDRTVQLIPVFTDYNLSTRMGGMLYDKDIAPCKLSTELPAGSPDAPKVWFLNLDFEDIASVKQAGIAIPETIETVDSLAQVRAMINRKLSALH